MRQHSGQLDIITISDSADINRIGEKLLEIITQEQKESTQSRKRCLRVSKWHKRSLKKRIHEKNGEKSSESLTYRRIIYASNVFI